LVGVVQQAIGVSPVSVARGVLFAFRDNDLERSFLARRLVQRQRSRPRTIISNLEELDEVMKAQADRYWQFCVELGRPPQRAEVNGCDDLFRLIPPGIRLYELVAKERNSECFETARRKRKEELLVQFALSQFGKRLFFK